MFNEFPYTNYEKINLDWLLDLGKKLKEDAESGAFDGERGPGIFGITTIYSENNQYYAINPGGVTVGDFILGYSSAAGTNILYIMKVTSVTGNYVNGTSITRITGPQGQPGPQGAQGEPGTVQDGSLTEAKFSNELKLKTVNAYVTPQMFGAKGDGVTDDSNAFIAALANSPVVLVPSGNYKITRQIEITNKSRLLANGTVRIYTAVENDFAFYIHGNEDEDYESTNYYCDNYKGVWFGGSDGGITIINSGGTNGILFGTKNDPANTLIGTNAMSCVCNVGVHNYDIGLKISNYNNYLNTFSRVNFERCGVCVQFGDMDTVKKNSGEMFRFFDCVFSSSTTAIDFKTLGWECSLINCSIDFCVVGFDDSSYVKVYFVNGHLEGIGKKNNETTYGIVVNQSASSLYSFVNTTIDISTQSKGTKLFYGSGNLILNTCYVSSVLKYPTTVDDAFLSSHKVIMLGTLFGQTGYRQYLSAENNLVPDALLSAATLGSTETDVTNWVKIVWKGNCTTEVVNGSMFANQKSIRVLGTGATGANATIRAIMPMESGKTYNIGLATYKHTSANLSRAVRVRFYDKNDNLLAETSNYLYQPDQSPVDKMWFPFISRQVTAPSGTIYAHVDYSISISGSGVLAVGEYIDVEYLYCEEY